jgi:two-component system, CAI-1 autoinducer sensor kinase/phosphatase CqsS
MLTLWSRLFAHYEAYHAYGPPRLKYMGYLGAITYVAFYFLRFTRPNPSLFDDLVPRLLAVFMFLLMGLKEHWPEKLKRYYIPYSYVVLLYCLPCFTLLVGLQRGGGVPTISNAFIILCFLVLLTDWRNTLVMLVAGTALATGIYVATSPNPKVPMDLLTQLPAFALILIGGNLFKFSTEQIDTERKLRATQALAGSIAHELRYPLARLKNSLERMQEVLPAPAARAQPAMLAREQVESLYVHLAHGEQAVRRGLQVISMTLDEVSARPIDSAAFSYLSAADVVHKAVEEYSYDSDEVRGRVSVQVQEDFTFKGDETAYLFVLFNLLKNSLYYVGPFPNTRVTITVAPQLIKVHDTGPGMAPEVVKGLFEPFHSAGKSGGTGLGLAYCQRVMRAFGGEIRCESVLHEFTEFTMRFQPISRQESQAYQDEVLQRASALFAGKRLLLVEDDAAQRVTTAHKLRPLGAVMDEAADGSRALDLLARHAYDLVLLDLNMPVLDGYALAEKLRQGAAPHNRDVCVVAYTSEPPQLAHVKTQRAGMDAFLSKPCAQVPLVLGLQQAYERKQARLRQAEGPSLAGQRVLLADDNMHSRRMVAAYLASAGVVVLEAGHGREVLEQLATQPVDAVLMDIHMPGEDGIETARAIRASGQSFATVPIIALTAHSDEAAVQAARQAGMSGYLVKPVEAGLLYDTLRAALGPSAQLQPAPAEATSGQEPLLNVPRLESYRRLGMLEELMTGNVPEIARLVGVLRHTVAQGELEATLDAMHSLLGMSGEAGALALYRRLRQLYVPMVEQRRWPATSGWLNDVELLAEQSEVALRDYVALQSQVA